MSEVLMPLLNAKTITNQFQYRMLSDSKANTIKNPALDLIRDTLITYNYIKAYKSQYITDISDITDVLDKLEEKRLAGASFKEEAYNLEMEVKYHSQALMMREKIIHKFSYTLLAEYQLENILLFSNYKILEMGAGSGYLGFLLNQMALKNGKESIVDIKCFDKDPCSLNPNEYGYTKEYYPVYKGSTRVIDKYKEQINNYTILLSWPPQEDNFGFNLLSKLIANRVLKFIYIGNTEMCANDKFYKLLFDKYELVKELSTIHFPMLEDNVLFFELK